MRERVLVAMSGGVDSSVAVALTQAQGYDCVGVTMHLCGDTAGAEDAARVAAEQNIEHHIVDFRDEFKKEVIEPFAQAYFEGVTPNPCIRCNRHMKFARLLAKADELGCAKIATGHYARVAKNEATGRYELRRAADPKKDQSYVLYVLTQEQLARVLFPLGDHTKEEIRGIAREKGFANAEKGESQDICFIPDGDYKAYLLDMDQKMRNENRPRCAKTNQKNRPLLQKNRPLLQGNIVDEAGNILGTHEGFIGYTIGQRKGLGLPSTEPWYVIAIRPATNEVVVGRRERAYGKELTANECNWVSIAPPKEAFRATAKVRYRHDAAACEVIPQPDGSVRVIFDEPQWAITRGQAVVIYDGDRVLGGGCITGGGAPC